MKIFLGILFLIFITWGGWYVYKNFLFPEPSKPVDEDVPKKLINAQERIIRLESNSEISKDINDIKKLPNDSFEVIFYNFGLVGGETKNYPFLILDIESAEEARAGITEWEKNMPKELSGIFADLENMKTEGKDSFHDQVIKNQTARIFESSGNKIVYTFYNQRLLIIAPSVEAFSAIISRYAVFPPN